MAFDDELFIIGSGNTSSGFQSYIFGINFIFTKFHWNENTVWIFNDDINWLLQIMPLRLQLCGFDWGQLLHWISPSVEKNQT